MKKLILIILMLTGIASGYLEIDGDFVRMWSADGLRSWSMSPSLSATNVDWVWVDVPGGAGQTLTSDGSNTMIWGVGMPTSLTDGGILIGNGTDPITSLGVAANGQIPIGDGDTDPLLATITGNVGIDVTNGAGSITLDFDATEIDTVTWGSGSDFTWTFDISGADPTLAFSSNRLTLTGDFLVDNLRLGGNTITTTTGELFLFNVDADAFIEIGDGIITLTTSEENIVLDTGGAIVTVDEDLTVGSDLTVDNDLMVSGLTTLKGDLLLDRELSAALSVITMDGSGDSPGKITYDSNNDIFVSNKDWRFAEDVTILGDLTVNTTTLVVDSTNALVGIGKTPAAGIILDVLGATGSGTKGDFISLISGDGGDVVSGGPVGTGSAGGSLIQVSGRGGDGSGGFAGNAGGPGGAFRLQSGIGGTGIDATTNNTGGKGGLFEFSGGDGGDAVTTTTANNTGGVGALAQFVAGDGGDAANASGTNIGGDGGDVQLSSGAGGTGATANGADGEITLRIASTTVIEIDSNKSTFITNDLTIKGGNELRLSDVGDSHYVGFEAPALTASQIWVLPDADGSAGEVLFTDGAGNLDWLPTVFGHMAVDDTQAIIVALTANTPAEVFDDGSTSAGDGWLAGELKNVTFPTGGTEHYLTVTVAGKYEVTWDMSFNMATPGANIEIHGGVAIDGTPVRVFGEAHRTIANNSDTGNMGGTVIIDCPNGTEEISLWIENPINNSDVTIEHGNMRIATPGPGAGGGGGGGGGDIFKTIAVAGQDDIVADGPTDTLTLVAGDNITLTTVAATDTVTIAATSGVDIKTIENHSAGDTLTEAESGSVHTNAGASGQITFNLPEAAAAGTYYWFTVSAGHAIVVQPHANDKFYGGTDGQKFTGTNAIGTNACFISDDTGDWHVISMFGTWTIS